MQMTVLDQHIVGNAPDDAVAVEISHRHPAHRNAIAFIQANGPVVERALVDHFIVGLVAINGEVLDENVRDAGALEQREIGGDLGITLEMETFFQAAIEFEAIAGRGDQRSLNNVGALAVGIFGNQTDTIAHLKPFGVSQGDLLIPMIAVYDEAGRGGRFLKEDGGFPAPQDADVGLEKDRVTQPVGPGRTRTVPPPRRAT